MQQDFWPKWKKASPELLVRYVNHEAARNALPLDFFVAQSGETFEDLRQANQLKMIIHVLYDKLRDLNIQYDREPPSMDESEQPVRTPYEIMTRHQGTCLDVAIFFASLCVEAHLLPILVLLRQGDSDHALVVVDTRYTWDQRDDARGWKEEDRQSGWIRGARRCWQKEGDFARYIDEGRYVPVECTGFAQSQAHGGLLATLSFEDACESARQKLAVMEDIATLDVGRMKSSQRGYEPYVLTPSRETQDEALRQRYAAAVRRAFSELPFAGISVEGDTAHSLSPNRAFRNMQFALESPADTSISLAELEKLEAAVILGPPGAGKSGTLKLLLDTCGAKPGTLPVYLPLRDLAGLSSDITTTSFFTRMAEQADKLLGISDATREFFERMIASHKCTCVLAFDALDELGDVALRKKAVLAIRMLASFPNTHIFLTSRPNEYWESPIQPKIKATIKRPDEDRKSSTSDPSGQQATPNFKVLSLQPFGPEEIREFLHTCFGDNGTLAGRIVMSEDLTELAHGSLQLGLLAILAEKRGGELPNDRYELFEEFVETAIITWEQIKGRDLDAPPLEIRRSLLERIAWVVQDRDNSSAPLLEEETLRIVEGACRGTSVTGNYVMILDWLARRTGLLRIVTQVGRRTTRRVYEFPHPQVREFLAGGELARRLTAEFDNTFASLSPHLFDMAWREVLHFAVGNLSHKGIVHHRLLGAVLGMNVPHDDLLHRRTMLAADLMCYCDFLDEAQEEHVARDLCTIGGTDACRAERAIQILQELGWQGHALRTLRSLALGEEGTNALLAMAEKSRAGMAEELRAEACMAICEYGDPEDASTVVKMVSSHMSSMSLRAYIARCWSVLGQPERAKRELLDLMNQADDDSSVDQVIGVLREEGFKAEAAAAEQERLAAKGRAFFSLQGSDRWQCAEWLWEHGALEPDGIELQSLFHGAIQALENLASPYGNEFDVQRATWFAERLSASGLPHAAVEFLENARLNPEIAWRGPKTSWGEMTEEEAASWHKTLVELAKSTHDNSRRRGIVHSLMSDGNTDRARPSLLNLLRHERTLRWTGEELVENLKERGCEKEVSVTLEQLVNDVQEEPSTRLAAAALLDKFFSESLFVAFEKSLAGLDETQAATSIIELFGNWSKIHSGPIYYTLIDSLAKDPRGVRILKAVRAALPESHRLSLYAGDALLDTLPPREALTVLEKQGATDTKIAQLVLRLIDADLGDNVLEILTRSKGASESQLYFLHTLWEGGDQTRALDWAQRVLGYQNLPIPLKLITAKKLVGWGKPPVGFVIPDHVLKEPENYCSKYAFGLGDFFRLLKTLSGVTFAQATFTQLLERGAKNPATVLDALDEAGDLLPWKSEWIDLLASVIRRADETNDLRCRLVAHLELHI